MRALFICRPLNFFVLFLLFQTVGYDPLVPAAFAAKFGIQFMELEQLWPIVDFITVHTPLMPATQGTVLFI